MKLKPILCGSDTISSVADEIKNAIMKSGDTLSNPYGDDWFTKRCRNNIRKIFDNRNLEIFPVITGTASNSLAISTICNNNGGIICHEESHINRDECGAPEFFSNGGKLITIASKNGKLNAESIVKKIKLYEKNTMYETKISGVSITQLSENGITYSLDELKKIGDLCKNKKLYFHMDGARFSNALVYLKKKPAEITWKIGLDCLSLGATKNGAYAAEVIIFFNKKLIKNFKYLQKKTGHILPRMKFISSQLNAWLENDLWLHLATKANKNAKSLRKILKNIPNIKFLFPTHGNEIFLELSKSDFEKIKLKKVFPKLWSIKKDKAIVRFVTSFAMDYDIIREIGKRLKILEKDI